MGGMADAATKEGQLVLVRNYGMHGSYGGVYVW